jgi:hypothetical protein
MIGWVIPVKLDGLTDKATSIPFRKDIWQWNMTFTYFYMYTCIHRIYRHMWYIYIYIIYMSIICLLYCIHVYVVFPWISPFHL